VGKSEGTRPFERLRLRWICGMQINVKNIVFGMAWFDLVQNRDRWRALVAVVLNMTFS
jgi:hypothetical protein